MQVLGKKNEVSKVFTRISVLRAERQKFLTLASSFHLQFGLDQIIVVSIAAVLVLAMEGRKGKS